MQGMPVTLDYPLAELLMSDVPGVNMFFTPIVFTDVHPDYKDALQDAQLLCILQNLLPWIDSVSRLTPGSITIEFLVFRTLFSCRTLWVESRKNSGTQRISAAFV